MVTKFVNGYCDPPMLLLTLIDLPYIETHNFNFGTFGICLQMLFYDNDLMLIHFNILSEVLVFCFPAGNPGPSCGHRPGSESQVPRGFHDEEMCK